MQLDARWLEKKIGFELFYSIGIACIWCIEYIKKEHEHIHRPTPTNTNNTNIYHQSSVAGSREQLGFSVSFNSLSLVSQHISTKHITRSICIE
jgi:hypothetical protein